MTIPPQIDLRYPDINTSGRITFQKHLQCLPGLQTAGITVPLPGHINCPGPGAGGIRKTPVAAGILHDAGHITGRHGGLCQGDGIQHFCRNTVCTGHLRIAVRNGLCNRLTHATACQHQQNGQNAATRHPSAPCCSTTGICPSPERSQRPASWFRVICRLRTFSGGMLCSRAH